MATFRAVSTKVFLRSQNDGLNSSLIDLFSIQLLQEFLGDREETEFLSAQKKDRSP